MFGAMTVVCILLAMALLHSVILSFTCLGLASALLTTEDSNDVNDVAEPDSSSSWPVLVATAMHASISLAAFFELMDSPTPKPRRLPGTVLPIHYSLRVVPEPEREVFWGQVRILVRATQTAESIILHAKNLHLDEKSLLVTEEVSGHAIVVQALEAEPQNQWYIIWLATPLLQDSHYTVNVAFSGQLLQEGGGLTWTRYNSGNETRLLVISHFEPTNARYVFPCFDEPALKARFNMSIATPPGMRALSNMPLREASEPVTELPGWVWSHFEQSVPMSTYLVAFAVSDFVQLQSEGAGNFSVWVRPGTEPQVALMVRMGPALLAALEQFTGLRYQLPKLDNLIIPNASPDGAFSGLENWGLIIYSEYAALYDQQKSSDGEKLNVLELLAHEIAHMWFGNLVTPAWWDHLWLKEGFAEYSAFVVVSKVFPEWPMEEYFVLSKLQSSLAIDTGKTTMHQAAASRAEIEDKYSIYSYENGAVLVRMMEHFLTTATFQAGVRLYLQQHSYQTAVAQDLFTSLNAAVNITSNELLPSGVGVAELMGPWVSQGGYPIITVTRNYSTGEATVCQKSFMPETKRDEKHSWWVPLSYTTQGKADFNTTSPKLWLPANQSCVTVTGLPGDDQWVIFNIQQTGYYRVNYDPHNWHLLADFLKSQQFTKIHVLNRAQLVDDAYFLQYDNEMGQDVFLNVTHYLVHETSPTPWLTVVGYGSYCEMLGEQPAIQESLSNLTQSLMEEVEKGDISYLWDKLFNAACFKTCAPISCKHNTYSKFAAFKADPINNRIYPGLRSVMYCGAMQDERATEEDLLFLWNQGQSTNLTEERLDIVNALQECPSSPELQHRLLVLLTMEGNWINPNELPDVIQNVCLKNNSINAIPMILDAAEERRPLLRIATPALKRITSFITRHSGSNENLGMMWCNVLASWYSGAKVRLLKE